MTAETPKTPTPDTEAELSPETNAQTETRDSEADASEADEAQVSSETSPEKSVEQLSAELDDLRDRLLRAVAEGENTKKRAARDVKDAREYAVTGFARDMLDIADNLSRAIASVDQETRENGSEAMKNLIEGVEMTERRLITTLERHGVKKVEPQIGDALDPNIHQAAAQVPSDQPVGKIAHVMQPGYVIASRTLRAAMVVVSSGPLASNGSESANVDVEA
ncbi:nucleotide exchange factor GrpE [Woodsholea maritima]|uniref:nucleotide exchange factor GrpE n=1 Tax=Woodsholea maritima TaxID=240237 RepID=UPI00037F53CD|nr:nucleotide exchange factor GrpE [Woodsholea maritima]